MSDRSSGQNQSESHPSAAGSAGPKCPVCKAGPVDESVASFPFCSARCRQIDLGRWMDERYVVSRPVEEADLDALE